MIKFTAPVPYHSQSTSHFITSSILTDTPFTASCENLANVGGKVATVRYPVCPASV